MENIRPKTLLIVDDHQIILDGLRSLFSEIDKYHVVGYLTSASEALKYILNLSVDFLITDIEMPEKSGIWLIEQTKKHRPEIKIIALTMHNEIPFIKKLYELGVDGYLLKTTSEAELRYAIDHVNTKGKHFSSEITQIMLTQEEPSPIINLTKRELETLNLIAEGYSSKEIAHTLHISNRTVEKHRASLLLKSGTKNVADLIRYGFKNALIK